MPERDPYLDTQSHSAIDDEQFIPFPTPDEEKKMGASDVPEELPVLALRNTVLYPGVVLPITLGRDSSIRLVRDAFAGKRIIGAVAQKRSEIETPGAEDLYRLGTVAEILKLIKIPGGPNSMIIQGRRRFEIRRYVQVEPYFKAQASPIEEDWDADEIELKARIRSVKELAIQFVNLAPHLPGEAAVAVQQIDSPPLLVHFIASNLQISVEEKQALLESNGLVQRTDKLMEYLNREIQMLQVSEDIRSRVRTDVDKQQREYLLRQQMKIIQDELGESENDGDEAKELRTRAKKKSLPDHVRETVDKEITRLARSNPASPDYAVTRNYVDWLLDLPWLDYSKDDIDIPRAAEVLDEDHYGLDQVKKRILEYLAVLHLKGDMKAPILCLHGPPGVGKTSLGKSIARAIGRKFVRMSLGGVRDEAEIRGHRRTYVAALPGRIIQGIKRAGVNNPVFMLDEVDKIGADFRGDPASALLEVLDPEQNDNFNDHYVELDYDLSKVFFIATANFPEMIPGPLRDRMESIEITGYTREEKLRIAKQYLAPRQLDQNGLSNEQLIFEDEAIRTMIDGYTRESGVRKLERTISAVARGVAKEIATGEAASSTIRPEDLERYLGGRKHFPEVAQYTEVPGVATGLAWTPTGGDILFIEASVSRGSGKHVLTGKLGDVMKESAQAALSYVKSRADQLSIPEDAFRRWDVHIHVPAGAVPKDGPSAGAAMLSALVSIYTQRRIRHDIAMTGEITLRGLILPVGGVKEKVLAARRAGVRTVVLPEKNEKDVREIADDALEGLRILYARRVEDVLDRALEEKPVTDVQEMFCVSPEEEHAGKPLAQDANGSTAADVGMEIA